LALIVSTVLCYGGNVAIIQVTFNHEGDATPVDDVTWWCHATGIQYLQHVSHITPHHITMRKRKQHGQACTPVGI